MIFRKTLGSTALQVVPVIAEHEALSSLSVESSLLKADFTGMSEASALESIREMDEHIGGLIANADEVLLIAALSAIKTAVIGFETDVRRECSLIKSASAEAAGTDSPQESQLHGEQHTAIENASNSNEADSNSNSDKELNTNGETNESTRTRRKRN